MAIQNSSKLQTLLASWPARGVLTTAGLKELGYSHVLLNQYRKSGWLISVGRGALARPGDDIDWTGGLYALQEHLKLPIHLGAKSALAFQGAAHFLNFKNAAATLFAAPGTRLPSWFKTYEWKVPVKLVTTNLFPDNAGILPVNAETFSINMSSRERAMFEALYLAPELQSLQEAKLLMGGLTNLRPQVVQRLLETCTSVKVKRLFMMFAEELKLAWVKKLDLEKVDFGVGARTIIKGGKTHGKYRITVPADLFDEAQR